MYNVLQYESILLFLSIEMNNTDCKCGTNILKSCFSNIENNSKIENVLRTQPVENCPFSKCTVKPVQKGHSGEP